MAPANFTSGWLGNGQAAWHGQGVVTEGTLPAREAFETADALFTVEKRELTYPANFTGYPGSEYKPAGVFGVVLKFAFVFNVGGIEKFSLLDSKECVCSFKRLSRWKGAFSDDPLAVPGSLSVAEPARVKVCGHCCSIYLNTDWDSRW